MNGSPHVRGDGPASAPLKVRAQTPSPQEKCVTPDPRGLFESGRTTPTHPI